MPELRKFDPVDVLLRMTMDKLSNNELVEVHDEWIEEVGEEFKSALRNHFIPRKEGFSGLRMSNLGKPLCQLQQEALSENTKNRMPYNHILRMIIGDITETAVQLLLKSAGINITGGKDQVKLEINGVEINGTDDIEIDDEVWDIKSASPYAFNNKWHDWETLYNDDSFGYVEQLYGYAKAKNKKMGGWIVVDKSSGEIKIVRATPTNKQLKEIQKRIETVVSNFHSENPLEFSRGFEEEQEFFRKKPTGNSLVPLVCTYCPFMKDSKCWPDAVLKPKAKSQAAEPKMVWYSKYEDTSS